MGLFTDRSLVTHLSLASLIDVSLYRGLRKTKCPTRVNIFVWIMLQVNLDCASPLQKSILFIANLLICAIYVVWIKNTFSTFFRVSLCSKLLVWLLQIFNFRWVYDGSLSGNVLQILSGPDLMKTSSILWCNAVKALLVEIWLERNPCVFHNTTSVWYDRFDYAHLNASSWCSMVKGFQDQSTKDIYLNWQAFIV